MVKIQYISWISDRKLKFKPNIYEIYNKYWIIAEIIYDINIYVQQSFPLLEEDSFWYLSIYLF